MKYLKYYESKLKKEELKQTGLMVCVKDIFIQEDTPMIYSGEYVRYRINDDKVDIETFGFSNNSEPEDYYSYQIELSQFKKNLIGFDIIDDSKPYSISREDGIRYFNTDHKLHREDGPAVEWSDGSSQWWLNGDLHREDGPAIDNDNHYEWWLNGDQFENEKDLRKALSRKDSELTEEILLDLLTNLVDEFDEFSGIEENQSKEFSAGFHGGSPKNIYMLLSEIESRIKEYEYDLGSSYDGVSVLNLRFH